MLINKLFKVSKFYQKCSQFTQVIRIKPQNTMSLKVNQQQKFLSAQQNILNDLELSNLIPKDILGFLKLNNNSYNLELCQKFIYYYTHKQEIIQYLKENHKYIDTGLVEFTLTNLISRIANEATIDETHTLQMKKLLQICKDCHIKSYTIFSDCEKFYLKVIKNDLDPSFLPSFVDFLYTRNFKTNDEYFGDIISRFIMSNIANFNYNDLIFTLPTLARFRYISKSVWNSIEMCIIDKISSLYKTTTLEHLCVAYDRENTTDRVFWSLMDYHIKLQHKLMKKDDFHWFNSIAITMKYCYAPLAYDLVEKQVQSFSMRNTNNYEKYIDLTHSVRFINKNIVDKFAAENINKIFVYFLRTKPHDLFPITVKLLETELINFVNFNLLSDNDIKAVCKIHPYNSVKLELFYKLSNYDKRFVEFYKQLEIWQKNYTVQYFIELVGFISNNCKNEINEFYLKVLNNLEKLSQENDEIILLYLFKTFPLYMNNLDSSKKEKFVNKFSDTFLLDKNVFEKFTKEESELKEFSIIKSIFDSDEFKYKVDIDELNDFKMIRDLANISIAEMSKLYNCDFYSSKYEKLYSQ
jgi:hypothetical protein